MKNNILPKACDFCKRYGRTCICVPWGRYGFKMTHPKCLNVLPPQHFQWTGTMPKDPSIIVRRVYTGKCNYWIVKPDDSHPIWKNRRKKFVRNSARQKRKERVYYR